MKATKTIAALCAIGMAVSAMALPVQAKTSSKVETEVITMDDTTTTTKSKSTTTSKTTGTKKSKSSQVSWKNAGKPLKYTVKTEQDFYKAYSNAIRLNAPTLKVTFDKSYTGKKLAGSDCLFDEYRNRYLYDLGMVGYGGCCSDWQNIKHNADRSVATFTLHSNYYGTPLVYAYNTGDTSVIDDKYKTMYDVFSEAADGCTETTDLGKAEYAWNWVIDNMVYDLNFGLSNSFVKIWEKPTADGKYRGVCEDYTEAYIMLMRMLSVPCWKTMCNVEKGFTGTKTFTEDDLHAIACAKIDGEYRYFDPTFGKTQSIGTKAFNLTSKEASKYYTPYVYTYEVTNNNDRRNVSYSELEKYFIW